MTSQGLAWARPPERLVCDSPHVHVWRAELDGLTADVQTLGQTLERDERERAERFWTSEDRRRYIVGRAVLRTVLARYLNCKAEHLRFSRGPYGKPLLAGPRTSHGLRFSVSHAGGLALYSVSRARETGVDLERVRDDLPTRRLAERSFSPRTLALLSNLSPQQFAEGFFACWTRREAYLKARGCGFAHGWQHGLDEEAGWLLEDLRPGPGYVGALAVEGKSYQLHCWEWSPH